MSELKPCPFCGESKLLYSGGCGFRYDDDNNQIRLFRVHCRTCKGRTGVFESLDEAIEAWNRRTNSTTIQPSALGTNLAEVGTECISRQAAIDGLNDAVHEHNITDFDAVATILALPSVTPKQRTGKWIDGIIPNDGGGLPVIVCDQCNTFFPLQFGDGHNFCPNCGADMREVTT